MPPLDNDPEKDGSPSDHSIVMIKPISVINNKPSRTAQNVTYRPITEGGMYKMQEWLESKDWNEEAQDKNAHELASYLMGLLNSKTNEFFPPKSRKINSDNQPFFTQKLVTLKRKKQREYTKHRKSAKWKRLENEYKEKLGKAKKQYYKKEIANLKNSDPQKWFCWLKRFTTKEQLKEKEIVIDEISHMTHENQAEVLADSFAKISQEYDSLKKEDIHIPYFTSESIPIISACTNCGKTFRRNYYKQGHNKR